MSWCSQIPLPQLKNVVFLHFETVSQTARQGDIKQITLITTQFM